MASQQQMRPRAKTPPLINTDTLSMDDLSRITKEAMQGVPPTLTSAEALAFRQEIEAGLMELRAKGMGVKLVIH
ncbi:MAG: hypothetical protein ACREJN_18950 [Nitrospiraceae bacterium]